MVDASSIGAFKDRLDKIRRTRVGFLWINRPYKVRYVAYLYHTSATNIVLLNLHGS